jgi:hypothetical protein
LSIIKDAPQETSDAGLIIFHLECYPWQVENTLVAAICTGKGENQGNGTNLVVCYPEMNLQMAKELMVQHGFQQLPVVTRNGTQWQYHKLVGLLDGDGITRCVKYANSLFLHSYVLYCNENSGLISPAAVASLTIQLISLLVPLVDHAQRFLMTLLPGSFEIMPRTVAKN